MPFLRTQLQYRLVISLLQIADLFLILLAYIERVSLEGILHALPGVVYPAFDLRLRQIISPARLGYRCLPLNDLRTSIYVAPTI